MSALLQQFIQETRECVEQIGHQLLALEGSPGDQAIVDELFRLVHTLKGNTGLFDFSQLTRLLHAGEDLLDAVREGRVSFVSDMADELLECADLVGRINDGIESDGREPGHCAARSTELAAKMRAFLTAGAAPGAPGNASAVVPTRETPALPAALMASLAGLSGDQRADAWQRVSSGQAVATHVRYEPEPECFYKGEDPFYLALQIPDTVAFVVSAREAWPEATELDAYRCVLRFDLLTLAPAGELADRFRYVPEQVVCTPQSAHILALADPNSSAAQAAAKSSADKPASVAKPAAPSALSDEDLALWTEIWDAQAEQLDAVCPVAMLPGCLAAVAVTLEAMLVCRGADAAGLAMIPQALEEAIAALDPAPLRVLIDRLRPAAPVAPSLPLEAVPAGEKSAVVASEEAATEKYGRRAEDHVPDKGMRVLKVTQEKVDRLMELIGEMVVAKNSLPYLAGRAENEFGARELGREIKNQYAVINRIAEEMQDAIMQVRMLPVGTVLQRFPRMVRDLSRKLGKQVNLVLEGEDTECDKNIIEALADPLVHVLRNSLDHGIEAPDVRTAAGKSAAGTIRIRSYQEGDRVVLVVSDDGRGIDPMLVKRKAFEKGLIDEERLESLTDEEAVQLIFLAGFSTAAEISDVSGRGVGMDAVRSAVERVNGTVHFKSAQGKGTELRITLPMSMAVSNVMMVTSAGQSFGVPMDLVVETVRIAADEVHSFKQQKAAYLRGRVVPLFDLNRLLHLPQEQLRNDEDETAVLVIRMQGENVGLAVDDFHETLDIILKPLDGPLADLPGYSGTALLGNGSVLMVLNPKELM